METQQPSRNIVNINGHNIYTEIYGPQGAPVVVLLHHGLGSARSWKAQIPDLAANYRVIIYDRWGYGKSDPRSRLSMPYFTEDQEDLLTLLDLFEIEHVSMAGHSDGGTIALYFTAQHPDRVSHLVTAAAHIYIETKMEPGVMSLQNNYKNDIRFRERLRRLHGDKSEIVFYNWINGWSRPENLTWDMCPVIMNIICPTLIMQGIEDEYATPQHARDIAAAISGAELWLLPDAGHSLPQEEPEAFNHKMLEFLGQIIEKEIQKD